MKSQQLLIHVKCRLPQAVVLTIQAVIKAGSNLDLPVKCRICRIVHVSTLHEKAAVVDTGMTLLCEWHDRGCHVWMFDWHVTAL
jgi:prepilin-type processing-associated H-X9-DG protein